MRLKIAIGIVVSVIFLYLTFRQVQVDELMFAFKAGEHLWIIPAFILMLVSHWIRALRWRFIIEPLKSIKTPPLFSALMIGYATNNVFPLRMGEFLRAYAIGKSQKVSKSSAFATVVMERFVLDLTALLLILGIALAFSPIQLPYKETVEKGGYVVLTIVIMMTAASIFLSTKTQSTLAFIKRFLPARIYHLVETTLVSFVKGCLVFKKSEHYLNIFISTCIIWLLYIASLYLTFQIFGFQTDYSFTLWHSIVVLVIVTFAIMLPSSPGALGTYHFLCTEVVKYYGVSSEQGAAFALISHAMNIIPFTIIGLVYFWKENLHFSDAVREKELVEKETEEKELPGLEG
ncbi:MAG: lysylphosphatidylglycerol synthase transmembrane domain-containing protein [bacterium]